MSFHTLAYAASCTTATDTDLTPVPDLIIPIQNGHFLPQRQKSILWATAFSTDIQYARIITPTLRQISSPYIRPVISGVVPPDLMEVADYRMQPLQLMPIEEVEVLANQASGGSLYTIALLGISDSPALIAPAGQIYCMQGKSTTAAVAYTWTQVAMTWQDTLPSGQYAVVGLEYAGVDALAARLQFQNQVDQPGCPGTGLIYNRTARMFQNGGLGNWGSFYNYAMPQVSVLNVTTTAVHTINLYYVRTG